MSNDAFELKVKIKATGDELSLKHVMDEYERMLGGVERGEGATAQSNKKGGSFSKLFNKFNIGLASATAGLYALKNVADKVAQTQKETYATEGHKAQEYNALAQEYKTDPATIKALENMAELNHIPFEELTIALSEFALKREKGDINGISTKNFMGKDIADEFFNFVMSGLTAKNMSEADKIEMLFGLAMSGNNANKFLKLGANSQQNWQYYSQDKAEYRNKDFNSYNKDMSDFDRVLIRAKQNGELDKQLEKQKAILNPNSKKLNLDQSYKDGQQMQMDIINNFGKGAQALAESSISFSNAVDNFVNTIAGSRTMAENLKDNIKNKQMFGGMIKY